MTDISQKKVAFIGCGVMGGSLVKAVSKIIPASHIYIMDIDKKAVQKLAAETHAVIVFDYKELASKKPDFLILATKPPYILQVLQNVLTANTNSIPPVLISIAAGITLASLQDTIEQNIQKQDSHAKKLPILVRLMPNTPAQIGQGMIAFSIGTTDNNTATHTTNSIKALFAKAGCVEEVPETLMNAVTAISGSGPAYVFMFIEALADAAVSFGIPRDKAYTFAAQTVKGSASMVLENGQHPAELKDAVCSPAGTTIAAVTALEKTGLRSALQSAAQAAFDKAEKMSK
ncbi:MAG TPA: pyrroline-5-carboxylate reductase [Treponemataceae bacterium]|nr:pyrroline-5-carboxylate reductase [Treponemataceae bacterium]